ERAAGNPIGGDSLEDVSSIVQREAGAYPACEQQLSRIVVANHQRLDVRGVRLEAPDDELLPAIELHLDPGGAAPAGFVHRVASLGHDALEAQLPDGVFDLICCSGQRI